MHVRQTCAFSLIDVHASSSIRRGVACRGIPALLPVQEDFQTEDTSEPAHENGKIVRGYATFLLVMQQTGRHMDETLSGGYRYFAVARPGSGRIAGGGMSSFQVHMAYTVRYIHMMVAVI